MPQLGKFGLPLTGAQVLDKLGGDALDAALLQLPMLGLAIDDATLRRTREAVERDLGAGELLHRYRGGDGIAEPEGAFVVCSFWLVDALLCEGKAAEAQALFDRLLARANDVDLFAEQIDPRSGEFLGNFPQAFTHLGLLSAAVNLDLARRHGAAAVRGRAFGERAQRRIGASFGWRGVLAGLRQSGRINLRSSRASRLPAAWAVRD